MPVLSKSKRTTLEEELRKRGDALFAAIQPRGLRSLREGCGRGGQSWMTGHAMTATVGNDMDIRLAVDDFKVILAEIRKLK